MFMLKWKQFERKDRVKKDGKILKNKKIKPVDEIERKRQEIRDKMNVFVNGPSSYSEGLVFKENLNNEMIITPEWILSKFSWSQDAGEGNILLNSDSNNSPWVELALEHLGIQYLKVEDIDYNGHAFITFKLFFDGVNSYSSWNKEIRALNPDKFIEGDQSMSE
jgi:hypothetical protein